MFESNFSEQRASVSTVTGFGTKVAWIFVESEPFTLPRNPRHLLLQDTLQFLSSIVTVRSSIQIFHISANMHTSLTSYAAAVLAISLPATNAFWRLECDGSVGLARVDPLMDFGGLSDHIHTIKGGSGKHKTGPQICLTSHGGFVTPHVRPYIQSLWRGRCSRSTF